MKENVLYGYSGYSRIQGYTDIQDIQALKHDLRKQLEQISPQKNKQIPGNVETCNLRGAKISHQSFNKRQKKKKTILRYNVDNATCSFAAELTDSLWGQG